MVNTSLRCPFFGYYVYKMFCIEFLGKSRRIQTSAKNYFTFIVVSLSVAAVRAKFTVKIYF